MDEIEFKVIGFKELQEQLDRLPRQASKNVMRKGLRNASAIWEEEMRATAPHLVHPSLGVPPGFLADHIRVRTAVRGDELFGIASVGPEKFDYPDRGGGYRKKTIKGRLRDVGRIAASRVASMLEFGTRKMHAQPFIRRAFETRKMDVLEAFKVELRDALDRAGLKLS